MKFSSRVFALLLLSAFAGSAALSEPDAVYTEKLDGFLRINIDDLNLQPSLNPTDSLWQLFSASPNQEQKSLSLRTVMYGGVAIVDLKIEGVSEPRVRSLFYRAVVEKSRFGWVVTNLGRKHKCGRFGLGVIPVWTNTTCP